MTFLQDLSLNPSSFVFCRCCIVFQNHRLYYIRYFFARESINVCPVYENMLFLTVALKPSRQSEYMSKIPKYKKVINTQNSTHLLILIQSVLSSGNLAQLGSRKSEDPSRLSYKGDLNLRHAISSTYQMLFWSSCLRRVVCESLGTVLRVQLW